MKIDKVLHKIVTNSRICTSDPIEETDQYRVYEDIVHVGDAEYIVIEKDYEIRDMGYDITIKGDDFEVKVTYITPQGRCKSTVEYIRGTEDDVRQFTVALLVQYSDLFIDD